MDEHRFQPTKIDVERDRGLTLGFGDGFEAFFSIEELRTTCPCATCRGVRDAGGVAWPVPSSPQPLRIEDVRTVGAWGLGFLWNDGHDTGIFPFELLRKWREDDAD